MSLLAGWHPRKRPPLLNLATAMMAAFGALVLWWASEIHPPDRSALAVFEVQRRDFWLDDRSTHRGALRPSFSSHRLSVRPSDGASTTLILPGRLPLLLDSEAETTPLTVRANLRSGTMLEIASSTRTLLAYEDAAANARAQARKETLFGLMFIGAAMLIYWTKGR